MSYRPEAGDLVWTDFDPQVGREQRDRRPALVVSPGLFWQASRFAIVCPSFEIHALPRFSAALCLPPLRNS